MVLERKINAASVGMASLDPLDPGLELLHFGFRGLTRDADRHLEALGLSRVHHRILYVLARAPGTPVGALAETLGISKQALHRPLTHLLASGLVDYSRSPEQHRFKRLALTAPGARLEAEASEHERRALRDALASTDEAGREGWQRVMQALAERLN